MEIYTKAEGKFKTVSDKYKSGSEAARVSSPIEFEGVKYREVIFNQSFFGKIRREVKGVLYITEDGEVVTDPEVLKEIAGLAYYVDIFFNTQSRESLKGAITSEIQDTRERNEYELMIKGLAFLKDKGVQGNEVASDVIRKLPETRRQNNEAIRAVTERVDAIAAQGEVFTPEILIELNDLYNKALLANFQRVKVIARGAKYYDDVKKQAGKLRKKVRTRAVGREVVEGLTRLEVAIGHFVKMLLVYSKVVNMSQNQYIDFLKQVEREKIEARVKMNRA